MDQQDVGEFTDKLNEHVPIDDSEKLAKLIRVIALQLKKATFRFNVDKLELDLLTVTHENFKSKLVAFFNKVRSNRKVEKPIEVQSTILPKARRKKKKTKKNRKSGPKKKVNQISNASSNGKKKTVKTDQLATSKGSRPKPSSRKRSHERIYITTWGDDPYTPPPMEE
jgi:hypothetical protein